MSHPNAKHRPASRESSPREQGANPWEASAAETTVKVGLNAAIVGVDEDKPLVMTVRYDETVSNAEAGREDQGIPGLPFGPFEPHRHRTLDSGLRQWVAEQTDLQLGYAEQLYTFGDRGREFEFGGGPRIISVGYLALTNRVSDDPAPLASWEDWYRYFPWEDWRDTEPPVLAEVIRPALIRWAERAEMGPERDHKRERAALCFGSDGIAWDEEKVLDRYELLYEAGLVYEAARDRGPRPDTPERPLGLPMRFDHRRILATAMSRLRGKLKYRPVVFELMPPTFTLFELQRVVEAISGVRLHKQNFRRFVEKSGLVETTGDISTQTGGRPAARYRFRREVLLERLSAGVRFSATISKR
ncbi:MAG: NAD regulator [Pseudomonadota bacterium]